MKQTDLDRAVADATGETVRTIAARGFVLLEEGCGDVDSVRPPLFIDWDSEQQTPQLLPV